MSTKDDGVSLFYSVIGRLLFIALAAWVATIGWQALGTMAEMPPLCFWTAFKILLATFMCLRAVGWAKT